MMQSFGVYLCFMITTFCSLVISMWHWFQHHCPIRGMLAILVSVSCRGLKRKHFHWKPITPTLNNFVMQAVLLWKKGDYCWGGCILLKIGIWVSMSGTIKIPMNREIRIELDILQPKSFSIGMRYSTSSHVKRNLSATLAEVRKLNVKLVLWAAWVVV